MKILYHNDMDGLCAAAIMYDVLGRKQEGVVCIAVNYNIPFPLDRIDKDDKVWILDYSIPIQDLEALLQKTNNIVWIDHHESSMKGYPTTIKGVRSTAKSGCELTWEHCHPTTPAPRAVQYVGDRDTWKYVYGDITKFFYNGLQLLPNITPEDPMWEKMFLGDYVDEMIQQGEVIEQFKITQNAALVREYSYETVFDGYPCLAMNCPTKIDRLSNEMMKRGYPIVILYTFDGKNFTVSLYTASKDVDVSLIAEKYGKKYGISGGGHKNAAGFVAPELPFRRV